MLVYLNGAYLPQDQAVVPVEDRGFMLGDGIYEVTNTYSGRFFQLDAHLDRLERSAREVRLPLPVSRDELKRIFSDLMTRNNLPESSVYLQLTRGVAPRTHAFPAQANPTLLIMARPLQWPAESWWEEGVAAITYSDLRWSRCDIKTINLLPNAMANTAAQEAGAWEAILVRDGTAIEGSHSNFFAVFGDTVVTHPKDHRILGGITRDVVVRLCADLGIPLKEAAVPVDDLARANELFFTGTTCEVMPIVRVDGKAVGTAQPGPTARRLREALHRLAGPKYRPTS